MRDADQVRIVAAFDSFKGSLSSLEAGHAAAAGAVAAVPGVQVEVVAIADGGEGLLDAVLAARTGHEVRVETVDARGRLRSVAYVVLDDGSSVLEAAQTIGLTLVDVDESLPWTTSSYGLGVQLATVLASGPSRVRVGLGGTATTDGGTGLLLALGATIVDADGGPVGSSGNPLVSAIQVAMLPDLSRVDVLTDVTSPLLGPAGAARLFGPQKGANAADVDRLELLMGRWATALAQASGRPRTELVDAPGAGAAGGLGAAMLACGARLVPGFATVAALVGLETRIAGADLVITGEGSLDAQTALGKGPVGVADLARAYGVPVVALAGRVVHPLGTVGERFDATLGVHARPMTDGEALRAEVTRAGISATAGEVARFVARGL